jgi:replicative DNA helicase
MIKTRNPEFEKIILKGLLNDKNLCRKILANNYDESIFDVPVHRFIFRNAKNRFNKSNDIITEDDLKYINDTETKDEKEKSLKLTLIEEFFKDLNAIHNQPERYSFCWDELIKLYQKRAFLDISEKCLELLKNNPTIDPKDIFTRFEKESHNVKKSTNHVLVDKEDIFSQESVDKRIEKYENERGKGKSYGLPYFLPTLTEVTGGIKNTDLILFGGRQKVGKSITLLNQAVYLTSLGYNVAYVSIEQSKEEISLRADSLASELRHVDLKMRTLDQHNEVIYKTRLKDISKKNGKFYVIDIPRFCTLNLIEKEIKDLLDQGIVLNAIIIDYLGLLNSESDPGKFYFNVGLIAKQLKEFCREIKIPVITANQMTRASEKEKTKSASDIAYSDQIASHVDYFFAMHPLGEGKIEFQTVLARDSSAVTVKCIQRYERMILFEEKLESTEDDGEQDIFD